ncbi:MAG: ArgK/MeaB family GTPase [Solirubrobacteraceae bacterium]
MNDAAAGGRELGIRLRERDTSAAAAALNLLESRSPASRDQARALIAEVSPSRLGAELPAHIIGITGPPGVGKSSLVSRLISNWRTESRTVAVLAVDPTSRRTGGALLGDRARIEADPRDSGVFIRSTAAGERLGGLAPATRAAAGALAAAFDLVVIETVGVGQSETEVAEVADSVAVVVQPGAGDVLQYLKAGIMEVPDILVVTKADLGRLATRTASDVRAALGPLGRQDVAVLAVSSTAPPTGIDELVQALDAHRASIDLSARRLQARRREALSEFVEEYGERGLRALGGRREAESWLAQRDASLDAIALAGLLAERAAGG